MRDLKLLRRVLNEDFITAAIGIGGKHCEIFINPSITEIRSLVEDDDFRKIRFIIDFEANLNKLYVFPNVLLHYEVSKILKISKRYPDQGLICGEAAVENSGLLDFYGCDSISLIKDEFNSHYQNDPSEYINLVPEEMRNDMYIYKNLLDNGKLDWLKEWFGDSLENYFDEFVSIYA
jgi:hypothetical protein